MLKRFRGPMGLGVLATGEAAILYFDMAKHVFGAVYSNRSLVTTEVFLKAIATLFLVGMVQLLVRSKRLAGFAGSIPGHLTGLGILGTFVGIFFGLLDFNPNDLKSSVPQLLEGLKIAFATSIAGLAASTGLKTAHSIVMSVSVDQDDPFLPPMTSEPPTVVVRDSLAGVLSLSDPDFKKLVTRLEQLKNASPSFATFAQDLLRQFEARQKR